MKYLISVPNSVVPHFHQIAEFDKENWFVSSDPEQTKVGSGGGTAHLLSSLFREEKEQDFSEWLQKENRIIIHAGGQSRRLPAYAAMGKSLLPMPVFRWSRGQHLNQRLVHLQVPLFEKLINSAPLGLNTLIASGDTLIFQGDKLPEIPEADVVCLGLWLEPEKATNHGVFFARHDSPERLAFMLQKPSMEKIRDLVHEYYFLMDIGVWLLSEKAIQLLMKNCGWNNKQYDNIYPDFYDLYSTFGTALGDSPCEQNKEINDLSVALVNLEGGEFHHLGNTSELVSSNMAIQNRVNDQREIWHKQIKPHPSIFVLNAAINNNFTPSNQNIWVENASIPDSWGLNQNHVLTGIPQNKWSLQLEPGNCLDILPIGQKQVVIRNYAYYDSFRGQAKQESTRFMNSSLQNWLEKRDLLNCFREEELNGDIFDLSLFPVCPKDELNEGFIQWLMKSSPSKNEHFSMQWKNTRRLSCAEIGNSTLITKQEEQRLALRKSNYMALVKNYQHSVFYQLDLKKTAGDFVKYQLKLPEAVGTPAQSFLPIHDRMFRSQYQRLNKSNGRSEEKLAFTYLQEQISDLYRSKRVEPHINLLSDQIAWGRSPVRLDIAGGWTDTPPYCFLYGGKVLNVAVELNGQPPLHCYIKRHKQNKIILRSIDLGAREEIETFEAIQAYTNIQSAFSIPKAALALCGFLPEFCNKKYSSLDEQLQAIGGGLELSILSAVPKGSGLGTSSILAATVLGTLAEVCCLNWDKTEIGQRTLALEQLLTTGGGWQDQYGGLFEGIKLLETQRGKTQEPKVKWLPESILNVPENKNRILLYYTGITRVAKNILGEIVRGMFLNANEHLAILAELKQHAIHSYEALIQKDFQVFAQMIDRSWELNQQLDSGTNTDEIREIIKRIEPHILAQKLLGAGGGGFMLILAKDEKAVLQIKKKLANNPINKNARFVDFDVSDTGFQVTKS